MAKKTVFIASKIKYKFFEYLSQNFKEQVKRTLSKQNTWTTEQYMQSWLWKFPIYSKIVNQNEYELQQYLKLPLKKCDRSVLTKLRISAHSLFIETGRYSKPPIPREKHLCNFCKLFIVQNMINVDWIIMIYLMWTHIQMSIPLRNLSILKTLQLLEGYVVF